MTKPFGRWMVARRSSSDSAAAGPKRAAARNRVRTRVLMIQLICGKRSAFSIYRGKPAIRSGAIPAQARSTQALAGELVPPSTVVRRVCTDEDLPGARRRSDPTDDSRALYRRAASTMIRPRPRRSQVAAARDRKSALLDQGPQSADDRRRVPVFLPVGRSLRRQPRGECALADLAPYRFAQRIQLAQLALSSGCLRRSLSMMRGPRSDPRCPVPNSKPIIAAPMLADLRVFPHAGHALVDPRLAVSPRAGTPRRSADRIAAGSPVLGLRPIRRPLSRTVKLPNDEIFTSSPADSRSAIALMNPSTSPAASRRTNPASAQTASVSSRLVTVAIADRPSRSAVSIRVCCRRGGASKTSPRSPR